MDAPVRRTEVAGRDETPPPAIRPRKQLPSERGDARQRTPDRSIDPVSTLRILEHFSSTITPAYKLSRSSQGWQILLRHLRGDHSGTTARHLLPTHVGDTSLGSLLNTAFLRRENVDLLVCDFYANKAQTTTEPMRDYERSKKLYRKPRGRNNSTNFASLPAQTR